MSEHSPATALSETRKGAGTRPASRGQDEADGPPLYRTRRRGYFATTQNLTGSLRTSTQPDLCSELNELASFGAGVMNVAKSAWAVYSPGKRKYE